jgi:cell division transport system permease protein
MVKTGKTNAAKKGKPSYFMSILGVTIVLFIWGIFGLIWVYVQKYNQQAKEQVKIEVSLSEAASQTDIDNITAKIKAQPYINTFKFISKEDAYKFAISDEAIGLDSNATSGMVNFLPNEIEFTVKNQYVHPDTLLNIKNNLMLDANVISEVRMPKDVIANMSGFFDSIKWWIIGLAILLSILVVLLIDNTIRLAMYSNRFLIKTMQMVGATRNFIAIPMDKRAILNGFISAGISIFLLIGAIFLIERNIPGMAPLRDVGYFTWLFIGIIFLGVIITFISTHRSVIKYLKMKLDDLY